MEKKGARHGEEPIQTQPPRSSEVREGSGSNTTDNFFEQLEAINPLKALALKEFTIQES